MTQNARMAKDAWEPFASALREARAAKGFSSARAFYLKSGGRPYFGATYRQYMNVENGASSPSPQLVEKIALALQISSDEKRAKELFRSYLLCQLGSVNLLELILGAVGKASASAGGASMPPMRQALARQSEARAVMLSREQADAIDQNLESFWLWNLLINDSARWTPQDLANATKLKLADVKAALKSLVKHQLLAEEGGKFFCPNLRQVFRFPRDEHFALGREKHREYFKQIAAARPKRGLFRHYTLLRGSAQELLDYAPNLRAAVEGANICETTEHGPDTGLTVVEVVVDQLFKY
jgi:transcriptional regulator with XRE-family HTH domain